MQPPPNQQSRKIAVRRRAAAALLALVAATAFLLSVPEGEGTWIRRVAWAVTTTTEAKMENDDDGGLRILALGGSVTWGSTLKTERLRAAYPYVLGRRHPSVSRVDNLAIRATGAEYPSTCLQSMIRAAAAASDPDDAWGDDPDPDYDVILLEFSLNGRVGLPLLLARLRGRYPRAIIIYVSLFDAKFREPNRVISITSPHSEWAVLSGMPEADVPPPDDIYHFPRPWNDAVAVNRTRSLYFHSDLKHLNKAGHSLVADGLLSLLASLEPPSSPPRAGAARKTKGSWGAGDQCASWFSTGKVPADEVTLAGGSIEEFAPGKFAYEVPQSMQGGRANGVTVALANEGSGPTPLHIVHMTRGDPCQYPKMEVRVRSTMSAEDALASDGDEMKRTELLDPTNFDRFGVRGDVHVTRKAYAGVVPPGDRAEFTLRPVERTELPFRIVGLSMCAACVEMQRDVVYLREN